MTRDLLLALDQGTTSSRAIVFDGKGEIRATARRPIDQRFPEPGWVNQDPRQLWQTILETGREAIATANPDADRIAAIGVTNQRETSVLWERKSGLPVRPAIVWQSRQSVGVVQEFARRGMTDSFREITGLVPDATFSATHLAWWFENEPDLRRRAERGELLFGTVDSWLLWNLSGGREHLTDWTNASRTMLFDIRAGDWSEPLLNDLGVPRTLLPRVVPSAGVLFESDPDLFGIPIPVAAVAGDQQASLFGHRCFRPGSVKNTYGTGGFVLMQTGDEPVVSGAGLLTTVAWRADETTSYALEGGVWVAGAAVQWLRDGLGVIREAAEVEALAASVPDNGGVVFVPGFVGLGAPHWNADARGALLGLTRGTTAAHIARATLEAIALQTRDVVDAMAADLGVAPPELRVDGGAAENDLLLQLQADVLGISVVRPRSVETTALGVATMAGLAVGVWSSRDDLEAGSTGDRRFEPRMPASERNRLVAAWRRGVERAKDWVTPSE